MRGLTPFSSAEAEGTTDKIVGLFVELRESFRKQGNWEQADLIRDKLKGIGVFLEDSKDGTTWRMG